jgi:hypothetical protein
MLSVRECIAERENNSMPSLSVRRLTLNLGPTRKKAAGVLYAFIFIFTCAASPSGHLSTWIALFQCEHLAQRRSYGALEMRGDSIQIIACPSLNNYFRHFMPSALMRESLKV